MKKLFSTLLILALMLSLAACQPSTSAAQNPDSKYDQLLAYLQAGLFDQARAELDRLALEAGETLPVTPTLPDYWFVIGTLPSPTEPAETEPAPTQPPVTEPLVTEPAWETVEIDLHNFNDYFKPVHYLRADINGFGETEMVNAFCFFVARDGIELKEEACRLSIELKTGFADFAFTVDPADGTVTLGEMVDGNSFTGDPNVVDFEYRYVEDDLRFAAYYAARMTYSPEDTTISMPCYWSILRAKGTIVVRGSATDIPEPLG